jgi:hypothetical protein
VNAVKEETSMLDVVLAGGLVVAVAGVLQATTRRQVRCASPVALLREGMGGFEGADAEAVRAEFRRSGVLLPQRPHPIGFP